MRNYHMSSYDKFYSLIFPLSGERETFKRFFFIAAVHNFLYLGSDLILKKNLQHSLNSSLWKEMR